MHPLMSRSLLALAVASACTVAGLGAPRHAFADPGATRLSLLPQAAPPKNLDPSAPPPLPGGKKLFPSLSPITGQDRAVGYLPGDWNVEPSGAFTYRIPLEVPDGRAGMAPALALAYTSSSTAVGLLGIGWQLEGLSAIELCGQNLSQDGRVDGVGFDHQHPDPDQRDRFCLDGAKLVAISGDYGAPGTQYRTEVERHARITTSGDVGNGQPSRFKVELKSGRIREYRALPVPRRKATDSQPFPGVAPLLSDPIPDLVSAGAVVHTWVLDHESDRSGNRIEYVWTDPQVQADGFTASMPRLDRIKYTQHPGLKLTATREVRFHYVPLGAPEAQYRHGVRYLLDQRLSRIEMVAPALLSGGESTVAHIEPVWEYQLKYEGSPHALGRTRLTHVARCGIAPLPGSPTACTWHKRFQWDQTGAAPVFTSVSRGNYQVDPSPLDPADPFGWAQDLLAAQPPSAVVADLDGDGADDVVLDQRMPGDVAKLYVLRGVPMPAGHTNPLAQSVTMDNPAAARSHLGGARAVDLDGDGRAELVAHKTVQVSLPDGSNSVQNGLFVHALNGGLLESQSTALFGLSAGSGGSRVLFADLDGDSRPDALVGGAPHVGNQLNLPTAMTTEGYAFLTSYANQWKLYRNVGGSFGPAEPTGVESRCPAWISTQPGQGRARLETRVDFDGWALQQAYQFDWPYLQYLCRGEAHVGLTAKGQLDTHSASLPQPQQLPDIPELTTAPDIREQHGDFNGDGLEDTLLLERSSDPAETPKVAIRWNSGNGLGARVPLSGFYQPTIKNDSALQLIVADFNSDGRDDVLSLERPKYVFQFHPDPQQMIEAAQQAAQAALGEMRLKLSKGDGSFDTQTIAGGAGLYAQYAGIGTTQAGDFNGDGHLDLMRMVPTGGLQWTLQLLMQERHYADRIVEVHDEGTPWPRETVRYDYRWSDRPEPATPCAYPMACSQRGGVVVREVVSRAHLRDSVAEAARSLQYSYEDAVADLRGRGHIGFRKMRIWDPARPMEVVQEYSNRVLEQNRYYPRATEPERVTTVIPFGDALPGQPPRDGRSEGILARVSVLESPHKLRQYAGGKTWASEPGPWKLKVWEDPVNIDWGQVDDPANPTSEHIHGIDALPPKLERTGETLFDDYGNPVFIRTATSGGEQREISIGRKLDLGQWLLDMPTFQTTVSTAADGSSQTRQRGMDYDTSGRLIRVDAEPLSADLRVRHTQRIAWNKDGTLQKLESLAGDPAQPAATREQRFEYQPLIANFPDDRVYPSQTWSPFDPLAHRPSTWMIVHPAYGVPLAAMDVNGVQWHGRYDALGRELWSQTDGRAAVATSYAARPLAAAGASNGLTIATQVQGQTASVATDGLLRTLRHSDMGFDGKIDHTEVRYDLLGRVVQQSRPFPNGGGPTAFHSWSYDPLDRLRRQTNPLNEVTQFAYTFFETAVTDAENFKSGTRRNVDGQTAHSWNHDNGALTVDTHYQYGPFGLLQTVTDDAGHPTRYRHDALGRVVWQSDPNSGDSELDYNGLGEVVEVRHPATGAVSKLRYDGLGRLIRSEDEDGVSRFDWDTRPHGIGLLARSESPDQVVQVPDYDAFGRQIASELTLIPVPGGAVQSYRIGLGYDSAGALQQIDYPAVDGSGNPGLSVAMKRNAAEFVQEIGMFSGSMAYKPLWQVQARNLDDQLELGQFSNKVQVDPGYDLLGRTAELRASLSGNTLFQLGYRYWRNGLVRSRSDAVNGRNEQFSYDPLRRLDLWQLDVGGSTRITDYDYDPLGNLTRVRLNGNTVESNQFGNPAQPHTLTTHTENGVAEQYVYDARGRQVEGPQRKIKYTAFDLPRHIHSAAGTTRFQYDANGQRVLKQSGDKQRTVYFDGLYEHRLEAGKESHVFHIPGTDGDLGQVVWKAGVWQIDHTVQDALGSVGIVIDAIGQVSERQFHDPFGQRIQSNGLPYAGLQGAVHQGFTGHEHDAELGLINMRGRMYDPRLKRFLSMDPIVTAPAFGQSWNPYSYVWNSPLNNTDPSGFVVKTHCERLQELWGMQCGGGGGGGGGTGSSDPLTDPADHSMGSQDQADQKNKMGGPGGHPSIRDHVSRSEIRQHEGACNAAGGCEQPRQRAGLLAWYVPGDIDGDGLDDRLAVNPLAACATPVGFVVCATVAIGAGALVWYAADSSAEKVRKADQKIASLRDLAQLRAAGEARVAELTTQIEKLNARRVIAKRRADEAWQKRNAALDRKDVLEAARHGAEHDTQAQLEIDLGVAAAKLEGERKLEQQRLAQLDSQYDPATGRVKGSEALDAAVDERNAAGREAVKEIGDAAVKAGQAVGGAGGKK